MNTANINPSDLLDSHPDPITGEPGAQPLGTGLGAAGIGAASTVAGGVVGGPIGAVVGAIVGSVVGGLAGKDIAEQINPTFEDSYWRETYSSRPYVEEGSSYEDYQTAYRTGYEGYYHYGYPDRDYREIEVDLQRNYEANQNGSLPWEKVRYAVRDAWDRAASPKGR